MFDNMEYEDLSVQQEWAVFKALCGEELLAIVTDPKPSSDTAYEIMEMFSLLGFEDLQYCFLADIFFKCHGTTLHISECDNNPLDTETKKNKLINMFLNNIESDSVKDLFTKKVDYFS